jgi:hypothetical protein
MLYFVKQKSRSCREEKARAGCSILEEQLEKNLCCPYNHTFHLMKAMKIMLREEKQTAEQAC